MNEIGIPATGAEQSSIPEGKTQAGEQGGAESGARDENLGRVTSAWPRLTPEQRRAILAIVDAGEVKG
jgi:hypothetical protein